MIVEQFRAGGCLSYLVGCEERAAAILIDPEISLVDRYVGEARRHGVQIQYLLDTHTHADHFSASRELAGRLRVPVAMHRASPAPFVDIRVDDGETLIVGTLRLAILHTPGHTADSICVRVEDCLFTGDTLLIGGTGRTDLPSGDASALYASLERLLQLPDATRVYPAHDYHARSSTTLGQERTANPRLQAADRAAFVALMGGLDLKAPDHLTEALRVNCSGGHSVAQLIADAARGIAFISIEQLATGLGDGELVVLDVREAEAYRKAHIPGAVNIPRGQLELRVDAALPDPGRRIAVYCELGKISTLATAMLRKLGYARAIALDGGFRTWQEAGKPVETEA